MHGQLRPALVLFSALSLLTGLAYPLVVTVAARSFFPWQANGSLVETGGRIVGSELIGQGFATDRYFHSRPSAAGPNGYDASASGGSNLGPTNRILVERVRRDLALVRRENSEQPVPIDLVTTSASGLDPHISPAAADFQLVRVAHARGLREQMVRGLVRRLTEPRTLGILGEPRVNVLRLNLALDRLSTDEARPHPDG
ncbi:MAG: potassium-transporting ATPase subunit KdpC [Candidatus Binataceae bacterium]